MSFTWHERWSKAFDERIELKFATSTGIVVDDDSNSRTLIVNGPGPPYKVDPECYALCCWNGEPVFVSPLRKSHSLSCYKGRVSETTRFSLELDPEEGAWKLFEYIEHAQELGDGTLLIHMSQFVFLCRNAANGPALVTRIAKPFCGRVVAPLMHGALFLNDYSANATATAFFYDPSRGEQNVFLRDHQYRYRDRHFVFSDGKRAFALRNDGGLLLEWDTQGREHVISLRNGPTGCLFRSGTCRGYAIIGVNTHCEDEYDFEPYLYVGDGRFVQGPNNRGEWVAYGNSAYCLSKEGVLTCYEAHVTPDKLVNLCARSAARLGSSDELLKAIPVELRELVSSWT